MKQLPPRMLNEPKREVSVFGVILSVLIALLVALLFFEMWFARHIIPICVDGRSMNNTLQSGDWVYARRDAEPERGDIVIVDVSTLKEKDGSPLYRGIDTIIKRLVAVGGDEVKCTDGVLYIRYAGEEEFAPLPEPPERLGTCPDFGPVKVGEGEMFLLGDNHTNSEDSIGKGCLPFENIAGVVTEWSLEHKESITAWENFRQSIRDFFGKDK